MNRFFHIYKSVYKPFALCGAYFGTTTSIYKYYNDTPIVPLAQKVGQNALIGSVIGVAFPVTIPAGLYLVAKELKYISSSSPASLPSPASQPEPPSPPSSSSKSD